MSERRPEAVDLMEALRSCSTYKCLAQDNHRCVENSMRGNCPICFEFLFGAHAEQPACTMRAQLCA